MVSLREGGAPGLVLVHCPQLTQVLPTEVLLEWDASLFPMNVPHNDICRSNP